MRVFEFLEYMCLPHAHISLSCGACFSFFFFLSLFSVFFLGRERQRDTERRENKQALVPIWGFTPKCPYSPLKPGAGNTVQESCMSGRAPTTSSFFLNGVNLPT